MRYRREELLERIMALCKEKGLRQADIARAARVTPTAVYLWLKRNREPDIASLAGICENLGISADYLLFGKLPIHIDDNDNASE